MHALKLAMMLSFALFAPPAGAETLDVYVALKASPDTVEASLKTQAVLTARCARCLRQIANADEYPGRWNSSQKSCVDAPSGQCTPLSV